LLDDVKVTEYSQDSFYSQVGVVFQDSTVFNMTLKENIAFNSKVSARNLEKSVKASLLDGFIQELPEGLNTVVSERGTSLSGGQKQRLMLARALAIDPKVLFLDDFTARVDISTERQILENLKNMYKGLTLVSVTQKVEPIKEYDQIILLMEGEILAKGTHDELLKTSPEYVQIVNLQKSTETI
jgi:ATP-binding cassette subfamily B protein